MIKYGTLLAGTLATGNFRGGVAAASEIAEPDFFMSFLCWRFSERVGFQERETGLSGTRSELTVSDKE